MKRHLICKNNKWSNQLYKIHYFKKKLNNINNNYINKKKNLIRLKNSINFWLFFMFIQFIHQIQLINFFIFNQQLKNIETNNEMNPT